MPPVHAHFGLYRVLAPESTLETAPHTSFVRSVPIVAKVFKTRHNIHRSPLKPRYRGLHVRTTSRTDLCVGILSLLCCSEPPKAQMLHGLEQCRVEVLG